MTREDYINNINTFEIDNKKVQVIETKYRASLSELVKKIISNAEECVFLDEDYRILSFAEIEDAEQDLHVEFVEKNLIPIADCGENDFIVYNFNDDSWSKFNIIDETVFKKKNEFEEVLK